MKDKHINILLVIFGCIGIIMLTFAYNHNRQSGIAKENAELTAYRTAVNCAKNGGDMFYFAPSVVPKQSDTKIKLDCFKLTPEGFIFIKESK